ncbi:MAG: peptidylprolyl isomerase, partial [Verrucomicrobiota bacterium]
MTILKIQRILVSAVSLVVANALSAFTPEEEGLYAVFTTSEGELAAILYFQEAPLTVSNFVGLAENSISHYDHQTGVAQNKPFYDGLSFHKVIAGSIALTGSPDGTGNDGPGYIFPDEIAPSLKHDRKGILSMQNAGPNKNGSQFFFTLSDEGNAQLDGFHSVFGNIVSGLSVLDAISSSPTDSEGVPISPISINSITILREGSEAESFNASESLIANPLDLQLNFSFGEQESPAATFSRNPQIDYFYR